MKADAKADAPVAPASNKKMIIMIVAAMLVVGVGAGTAWFFMKGDDASAPAQKAAKPALPPEYVPVEQFVVNLQPENGGEQYLQVQFTLQVAGPEQVELVKANMAKVRNRVLMLLSAKRASEISTVEGKQHLAAEIVASLKEPFAEKGEPQEITDVLFTAFIIQ